MKSEIPNIPKLIPIITHFSIKKKVAERLHKYIYSATIIAKSTIDFLGLMTALLTDLKMEKTVV